MIVDGTKPGTSKCSRKASGAEPGPGLLPGSRLGLNGILVWNANNVWVQNLTVCNFLTGAGESGNEIWWDAAKVGPKSIGHGYVGSYLNATSTYFDQKHPDSAAAIWDLLKPLEWRHVEQDVREQLQRLGLLHRRVPAGL